MTALLDDYDAADDSRKSYDVAIAALREKLLSFRREIIGDATLWLGDCREILPLLPKVDAVVTDVLSSGHDKSAGRQQGTGGNGREALGHSDGARWSAAGCGSALDAGCEPEPGCGAWPPGPADADGAGKQCRPEW